MDRVLTKLPLLVGGNCLENAGGTFCESGNLDYGEPHRVAQRASYERGQKKKLENRKEQRTRL
jgi:hypothetical protein